VRGSGRAERDRTRWFLTARRDLTKGHRRASRKAALRGDSHQRGRL